MNSVKLLFFRARKSVAYWIVFALFCVLGAISAILAATIFRGGWGLSHLLILPLGMLTFSSESVFSSFFIPPYPFFLLSLGFALVFLGDDFRLGTIKSQALCGRSRISIFVSMLFAGFLLALSLIVVFQIFASLFSLFLQVPFYPEAGLKVGIGEMSSENLESQQQIWAFLQSLSVLFFAYLSCYTLCFTVTAMLKNGWAGVICGVIVFLGLFVVGMFFFSKSSESLNPDGAEPPSVLAELWLPHFWLRSFFSLSQNCVYQFTGKGEYITHSDYVGYLLMASHIETFFLFAFSLFTGIITFRKVDLK